jgi:hypothetical protein
VGVIVLILAWGLMEPYFIDETAYAVALPNLPDDWIGREAAVIADFQVGMWGDNLATIRRIVDRIRQRRPELVLILGDFVYHGGDEPDRRIATTVELLRPLSESQLTMVAVLGNHDYSVVNYDDPSIQEERAQQVRMALNKLGITILENDHVPVQSPADQTLYVVGLGSLMAGKSKPVLAFEDLPDDAPRLVILHNPSAFDDLAAGVAPLALAGHTHGGQFRLPFTPAWSWVTYLREEDVHVDGWIEDYGAKGNRLYVNRGIGFSKLPLRFNCPPELTWLTLKKAQGTMQPVRYIVFGETAGAT